MIEKIEDFNINYNIFDELLGYQNKLPSQAINGGYRNPAGLALLGADNNNNVDVSIYLKPSGGCWDAPTISHGAMEAGMISMIKKDRYVVGMALIRHPAWICSNPSRISNDLIANIKNFKNAFVDIEKTLWIIVANDSFRTYRVLKKNNKTTVEETKTKKIFDKKTISDSEYINTIKEKKKAISNEIRKKQLEAEELKKKQQAQDKELARQKAEIKKTKALEIKKINSDMTEKKIERIKLPDGTYLLKTKNGEWILWN